jgi:uncharacterized cupin superfamily protein
VAEIRHFNLFGDATDVAPDESDPPGYRCRAARLGPRLGASLMGMSVYELPAGEAICPYHFEWTDEEWLIVIDGRPTLRTPSREQQLSAGDVVCFPAGPEGAHQGRNATDEPVRVAMSDKIGIWAGGSEYMLRRSPQLDYWDGETRP